jgi:hypothetical protein
MLEKVLAYNISQIIRVRKSFQSSKRWSRPRLNGLKIN